MATDGIEIGLKQLRSLEQALAELRERNQRAPSKTLVRMIAQLEADGQCRIERRHRILEDHRHQRAAQACQLRLLAFQKIDAIEAQGFEGEAGPLLNSMEWIELRGMWNKNLLKMDSKEIGEARALLERYHLRVTDIASPLFKVDWPGAPRSKYSPKRDQFGADFGAEQQDEVLERSIELARAFNTDRVRCFDFWRLDDVAPHRNAIDAKLREATEKAAKKNVILVLENEMACNTATGKEAARLLGAVKSRNLMVNWDPGNAAMAGETPFPDGYALLPKDRIGHCHCKDIQKKARSSAMATT